MSAAPDKLTEISTKRSFWSGCRAFATHLILSAFLLLLLCWVVSAWFWIEGAVTKQGTELEAGLKKIANANAEAKVMVSACETSVKEMAKLAQLMRQEHAVVTKQLETAAEKMAELGLDMKGTLLRQGGMAGLDLSKRAAEALNAADDAIKRGDLKLAVNFLVNALHCDPTNLQNAQRYVNTIIKNGDANMLASAHLHLGQLLYQIRPADVHVMADLLEKIEAQEALLRKAEGSNDPALSKSIDAALSAAGKEKNPKLAAIYLVNALQRDPANMEIIKRYVDTVTKSKDADLLAGAQGLLGRLLYQIQPSDIPAVTAYLQQVAEVEQKKDAPAPPEALNQKIDAALAAKPGLEPTALAVWLENLIDLQEELAEAEPADADMQKKLGCEIDVAQACLKAVQIQKEIELRLKNVEESERLLDKNADEKSQTYALASLQAAELAVNAIWTIDHSLLPADLAAKIQGLPGELKKLATAVQEKAEVPEVAKLEKIWEDLENTVYTHYKSATRLEQCGQALALCSDQGSKFQSEAAKKKYREVYQKITHIMNAFRRKQFAAYQEWAVKEAEKSRAWFFNQKIKDEADVDSALSQSDIERIDLQLLSPETAQFVQDVISSMLAECGPEKRAEIQRKLTVAESTSFTTKQTLEDF